MSVVEVLARAREGKSLPVALVWGCRLVAEYEGHEAECAHVRHGVGLFDQTYRGVIDLTGVSVLELLERITSNHPAAIGVDQGQFSALLTAKGRLVASFQLFRHSADQYRLVLFDPVREGVLAELRKYAFLSDVSVEVRDSIGVLSLRGPRSESLIHDLGASCGPADLSWGAFDCEGQTVEVVRVVEEPLDSIYPGFDLHAPESVIVPLWDRLEALSREHAGGPIGWNAAESLRVEAGFARWDHDYREDSFPTEIGHGKALRYDKCYVGQEIVARMRTYGSDHRKLFRLFSSCEPACGSDIVDASGKTVGSVTSTARAAAAGAPQALGLIKRSAWEATDLRVTASNGSQEHLRIEPL